MKVFKFNPETGKRGELIDEIRIPSTQGQSIEFAQSKGVQTHLSFVMPKNNETAEWSSHLYMGRDDDQGNLVVNEFDAWVCCCTGKINGIWQWSVIPPYSSLAKNKAA